MPTISPSSKRPFTPSTYRYIATASANQDSQNIKTTGGTLFGFIIGNTTAATTRYVKFYNVASPTSASTPVLTIVCPAGTGGFIKAIFPNGIAFKTALSHRITGAVADSDATAVTAADIVINALYI